MENLIWWTAGPAVVLYYFIGSWFGRTCARDTFREAWTRGFGVSAQTVDGYLRLPLSSVFEKRMAPVFWFVRESRELSYSILVSVFWPLKVLSLVIGLMVVLFVHCGRQFLRGADESTLFL